MNRILLLSLTFVLAAGCNNEIDVTLTPPAAGTGFQLSTPRYMVPTGTEIQDCYYVQVPNGADGNPTTWAIHRFEVAQNRGSHHMNLFRASDAWVATNMPTAADATTPHPCFTPLPLMPDQLSLVLNNQTEVEDTAGGATNWELPPNVALQLHSGEWLVLQTHYVNATTQTTPIAGHVLINFHSIVPDTSTQYMCSLFANNRSIMLPPHSPYAATTTCAVPHGSCAMGHGACATDANCAMTTPGDTCTPNPDVHVVGLAGHFHSRGTKFTIRKWDGTSMVPGTGAQLYESTSWNHAPFATWSTEADAPLLHAGEGFDYTCEFFNDTDTTMVFGPHVETQEHCNVFAYYYPCVQPNVIYCF